jgi:hypothetical protein
MPSPTLGNSSRKALKIGERAALLAALSSRQHAQFIEALGKIVQEFSAHPDEA